VLAALLIDAVDPISTSIASGQSWHTWIVQIDRDTSIHERAP
jgi:hypothetical protein